MFCFVSSPFLCQVSSLSYTHRLYTGEQNTSRPFPTECSVLFLRRFCARFHRCHILTVCTLANKLHLDPFPRCCQCVSSPFPCQVSSLSYMNLGITLRVCVCACDVFTVCTLANKIRLDPLKNAQFVSSPFLSGFVAVWRAARVHLVKLSFLFCFFAVYVSGFVGITQRNTSG